MMMIEGQWPERLAEAETLLDDHPDHPDAGRLAGEALLRMRRLGEGVVRLREQVVRCPHDARAHDLLVEALLEQGRALEAFEAAELALAAHPGRARATYDRARAASMLGRDDHALLDLGEALGADGRLRVEADGDRAFQSLAGDPRFRALFED